MSTAIKKRLAQLEQTHVFKPVSLITPDVLARLSIEQLKRIKQRCADGEAVLVQDVLDGNV